MEGLHAGGAEAARVQQGRQSWWMCADQPGMGANLTTAQELGNERFECWPDAWDLA